MALEDLTGTKYIDSLVATNPVGATDPKSEGDDHIRGIKNTLLLSFPGVTGAVTATQAELNIMDGVTASTADLNATTNFEETISATTAEVTIPTTKTLNVTDNSGLKIAGTAISATAAELNYLDIAVLGTGAASKAVVLDAGDDYTWPATGVLTYSVLHDGTTALTATAAEINTVCDGVLTGSVVWNPASVVTGEKASVQLTVTGAAVGDFVLVAPGVDIQEFTHSGSVIATDTVELVLANNTGGAIDIASSTWKVKVLK